MNSPAPQTPQTEPLDDQHVLEPVTAENADSMGPEPVVRDARGRLWRVRRVSYVTDWMGPAVALLACVVLLLVLALGVV